VYEVMESLAHFSNLLDVENLPHSPLRWRRFHEYHQDVPNGHASRLAVRAK